MRFTQHIFQPQKAYEKTLATIPQARFGVDDHSQGRPVREPRFFRPTPNMKKMVNFLRKQSYWAVTIRGMIQVSGYPWCRVSLGEVGRTPICLVKQVYNIGLEEFLDHFDLLRNLPWKKTGFPASSSLFFAIDRPGVGRPLSRILAGAPKSQRGWECHWPPGFLGVESPWGMGDLPHQTWIMYDYVRYQLQRSEQTRDVRYDQLQRSKTVFSEI